jgi:tripartite-type tricarboxylate transporter receptor subunit TctC
VPAQNVKQLVALARSRAGQLNYGSFGAGSSANLMGELFNLMAKVNTVHVPYKGAAESAIALVAGQIDLSFVAVSTAQPFVVADRLRPLGVTSAKRASLMPSVPTLHESGLTGYDRSGWYGVVAPPGVPRDVIARLHAAITKVVSSPDVRKLFGSQGLEPQSNQPEQFTAFIRDQLAQNARLIKAIGLKAE